MKKKIIVVGGGITGCAIASILSTKKKYDIEIYDFSDQIGGVIKDLQSNNDFFFNGCHVLEDSYWLNLFLNYNKINNFIKTKLLHGSFSNIFGDEIINKKIAHPIYSRKVAINEIKNFNIINLKDRLLCYPEIIAKSLNAWVLKFIDPKKLSQDLSKTFHINRIFFKFHKEEIKKMKRQNTFFDEILGSFKKSKKNFFIPKYGYTKFLEEFRDYLIKKGVKINLKSPISIELTSNFPELKCRKKNIEYDRVIWAANPIILTSKLGINYENISIDYSIIAAQVKGLSIKKLNYYYQIYDKNSKIIRIFVYNINKTKISIELLNERISNNNIEYYQKEIVKLLFKIFKKKLTLTNIQFQNFKRFGYYSNKNLYQLEELYNYFENKKFIVRGIHFLGQEDKINELLKNFYKTEKNFN